MSSGEYSRGVVDGYRTGYKECEAEWAPLLVAVEDWAMNPGGEMANRLMAAVREVSGDLDLFAAEHRQQA